MSRVGARVVTCRGVNIYSKSHFDHRLKWSAAGFGAVDTLKGMKALIREKLDAPLSQ